jgi:hypothetical protein
MKWDGSSSTARLTSTRSEREGSRVKTTYFGAGDKGLLIAMLQAEERAEREVARAEWYDAATSSPLGVFGCCAADAPAFMHHGAQSVGVTDVMGSSEIETLLSQSI